MFGEDRTLLLYRVSFFRVSVKNSSGFVSEIAALLSEIHSTGEHTILETLSLALKAERFGDEHDTL